MRALALLAVWTLVACSKPSEPAGTGAPGASAADASVTAAAAPAPTQEAPAPTAASTGAQEDAGTAAPKVSGLCGSLAERYASIQKAAPRTCKVDADCSCHLILTQDRGLAVSDSSTAAKLQGISMAYRKARCPTNEASASQTCEPKCQAGKCQ